jgi:hypothetical protein
MHLNLRRCWCFSPTTERRKILLYIAKSQKSIVVGGKHQQGVGFTGPGTMGVEGCEKRSFAAGSG